MTDESRFPSYVAIWGWLLTLLVAALFCTYLPFGKTMAIFLIFSAAVLKAFLVVRHYMHLRTESLLIYAIAGIPVLLLLGMMLTLVPDIIFRH